MSSQYKSKRRRNKKWEDNLAISCKYNMDVYLLYTCQLWFNFFYSKLRHGVWNQTPRACAYKCWNASIYLTLLCRLGHWYAKKWTFLSQDEIFYASDCLYCHGGLQCSLPRYCTCFLYYTITAVYNINYCTYIMYFK